MPRFLTSKSGSDNRVSYFEDSRCAAAARFDSNETFNGHIALFPLSKLDLMSNTKYET